QQQIEAGGNAVHLRTPVQALCMENGKVVGVELENGEQHRYDAVISSMPLSLLVTRMLDAPKVVRDAAAQLQFRNTMLVYLKVEGNHHFPDNWLYVHSPDLKTGRITNFNNWLPQADRTHSILTLEYWCNPDDAIWHAAEHDLVDLACKEIRQTGLIGEHAIEDGMVVRIPRCYPVYRKGYKDLLGPIESYLKSLPNLQVIGRYGAFKYNNQDHSILMGMLAADNILHDRAHDLWGINTDYDSYQEQAAISETGLVRVE
ncbi:MAG: FAD-dependent oxidoreductase, partial [Bacteroidota bacterium]